MVVQPPATGARDFGYQAVNVEAFQEQGYFGGLLGHTASTRLYERTPREPRAKIPIAKAMNGVDAREQGLE